MTQILRHNNISYLKNSALLKQNTGKRIKKSLKHLFKLDFQYNLMQNGPLKSESLLVLFSMRFFFRNVNKFEYRKIFKVLKFDLSPLKRVLLDSELYETEIDF